MHAALITVGRRRRLRRSIESIGSRGAVGRATGSGPGIEGEERGEVEGEEGDEGGLEGGSVVG